ncbi:MAG: ABC transporter ATP-binding protein [bacterium]
MIRLIDVAGTRANVVELEQVTFGYNSKPVITAVSLQLKERDFVWVVGPNGGGKTTMIRLILGLLRPQQGTIRVFGKSPEAVRERIGYMPQQVHLDAHFPFTVLDVALMGRLGCARRFGPYRRRDREIALEALQQVGLLELSRRPLRELSGGQLRRLLIARALAAEPELLILDEPTANLDRKVERELFELLHQLNEQLTIILVSHDPAFVSDFVEEVVCVNHHVSIHPTSAMEGELVDELYGRQVRLVRHDQHQADTEGHDHD